MIVAWSIVINHTSSRREENSRVLVFCWPFSQNNQYLQAVKPIKLWASLKGSSICLAPFSQMENPKLERPREPLGKFLQGSVLQRWGFHSNVRRADAQNNSSPTMMWIIKKALTTRKPKSIVNFFSLAQKDKTICFAITPAGHSLRWAASIKGSSICRNRISLTSLASNLRRIR